MTNYDILIMPLSISVNTGGWVVVDYIGHCIIIMFNVVHTPGIAKPVADALSKHYSHSAASKRESTFDMNSIEVLILLVRQITCLFSTTKLLKPSTPKLKDVRT